MFLHYITPQDFCLNALLLHLLSVCTKQRSLSGDRLGQTPLQVNISPRELSKRPYSLAHTLKSYAASRPPILYPRQLFSSVRNCMGLRNTFHIIVQKYFWGPTRFEEDYWKCGGRHSSWSSFWGARYLNPWLEMTVSFFNIIFRENDFNAEICICKDHNQLQTFVLAFCLAGNLYPPMYVFVISK